MAILRGGQRQEERSSFAVREARSSIAVYEASLKLCAGRLACLRFGVTANGGHCESPDGLQAYSLPQPWLCRAQKVRRGGEGDDGLS